MTNKYTKSFTEEDREAMRKMAAETRLAKLEWAKENLRDNYKDHLLWRELASKHNIRLPQSHLPATSTILATATRFCALYEVSNMVQIFQKIKKQIITDKG